MIQFNLLPDVKLEYIKARRSKRMVLLVSGGVAAFAFLMFVVLFLAVNVFQPKHISDLNKDIAKYTATLKAVPNLDKILTVQNQLGSLTALHDQKPTTSRLIDYLGQMTPAQATIASAKLDYADNSLTLSGNADSLATVNKFVDTLKFTTYTVDGSTTSKNAFSNVVLGTFANSDKGSSYVISLKVDPVIFDGTKQVTLTTPKIISTRSETDKPGDLFQQKAGL
jgi:Tfp pilus assembly protein PilN